MLTNPCMIPFVIVSDWTSGETDVQYFGYVPSIQVAEEFRESVIYAV
jgi:hypothetical protein